MVDGIIYPDGRIDFVALLPDCEIYPHIQVDGGGETSVEILADRGQLQWNSGAIMGSNVSEDGRHYAVC
ncbi:MAG: hypothetical protein EOP85_13840 [Verrucomicrobiaceae bacterium]|nr:MAG: hypothetical protein EOP85_13840 [Verrucomicrobiaceae bacterium]